jgi:hypothetical protein
MAQTPKRAAAKRAARPSNDPNSNVKKGAIQKGEHLQSMGRVKKSLSVNGYGQKMRALPGGST